MSDTTQFVVGKVAITKKIKLHTISFTHQECYYCEKWGKLRNNEYIIHTFDIYYLPFAIKCNWSLFEI